MLCATLAKTGNPSSLGIPKKKQRSNTNSSPKNSPKTQPAILHQQSQHLFCRPKFSSILSSKLITFCTCLKFMWNLKINAQLLGWQKISWKNEPMKEPQNSIVSKQWINMTQTESEWLLPAIFQTSSDNPAILVHVHSFCNDSASQQWHCVCAGLLQLYLNSIQ